MSKHSRRGFTLVELLVVVAIIVMLMALLLPTLGRARYRAKIAACSNNLRQLVVGLNAYAADSSGWYPKRGFTRPELVNLVTSGSFDIRGIMRPYFNQTLTILNCPGTPGPQALDASRLPTASQYALFFDNFGSAENQNDSSIGGIGPRDYQYDVNGVRRPADGAASDQWTNIYKRQGGLMRKVGEYWRWNGGGAAQGTYFNLIASDQMLTYGGHPQYRRFANHHELVPQYSATTFKSARIWATPNGSSLFPPMAGNFAGQDGRVVFYRSPANTSPGTFTLTNYIIPSDFQVK